MEKLKFYSHDQNTTIYAGFINRPQNFIDQVEEALTIIKQYCLRSITVNNDSLNRLISIARFDGDTAQSVLRKVRTELDNGVWNYHDNLTEQYIEVFENYVEVVFNSGSRTHRYKILMKYPSGWKIRSYETTTVYLQETLIGADTIELSTTEGNISHD